MQFLKNNSLVQWFYDSKDVFKFLKESGVNGVYISYIKTNASFTKALRERKMISLKKKFKI